jgi:(1->4)-alpha-D-glucan 1-alpha-D-glucosylmutase
MAGFRVPTATYRMQFNREFNLTTSQALVAYLHDLGITDLYASPLFKARRGSRHGYSVTNPMELNPELGSRTAFDALARKLKARGMGLLFDIVPNHMALSPDNPWWMDVLENGPGSPYSIFFDIDWHPPDRILDGKVLLPILGKHYGQALEEGELGVSLDESGFFIKYYDHRFPLAPETYAHLLLHRFEDLTRVLGEANPAIISLRGIIALVGHLPSRDLVSRKKLRERRRDTEVIKKSLWLLYQGSPVVKEFLDENMKIFNGRKGDSESFNLLDRLLTVQPYRLSFWQVALQMINYRRFFSINDLIGIRIEDQKVFDAFKHDLLFRLIEEDKVTGIRADHIDGLSDPLEYLERLQKKLAQGVKTPAPETGFYVLVEKILAEDEGLPQEWPVSGTTGYDFLNIVNGLFVDEQGLRKLQTVYVDFTSLGARPTDVIYEKKRLVMEALFGGEVKTLGYDLSRLGSHDRQARDLSRRDLTRAMAGITACMPVYRTYIRNYTVSARDLGYLEKAMSDALRRDPYLNPLAMEFLKRVLFQEFQQSATWEQREERLQFIKRWQQFTGPIMAIGLEDTALYVYNPLVSLNEVGTTFKPTSIDAFHRFNQTRLKSWPFTMNTTSTHDTKRSEDVRARINVLSEVADEWEKSLKRWSGLNASKKVLVGGDPVPDPNEESLIYQTLIGSWPLLSEEVPSFKQRLKDYAIKAVREAKVHTQWISPEVEYENALLAFLDAILNEEGCNAFLEDFLTRLSSLTRPGVMNALCQVLLKIASPGVPDFYQGTELWDFSLVDPDNRRSVDFEKRTKWLADLILTESTSSIDALISNLLSNWKDGRIKLYTIYKALNFRREHRDLFLEGEYHPLIGSGPRKNNVVAFSRRKGSCWMLAAVPSLMTKAFLSDEFPLGKRPWGETFLSLHPEAPMTWVNVFTHETLNASVLQGSNILFLHQTFSRFPVALLSSN